jgi:hypothetical protein
VSRRTTAALCAARTWSKADDEEKGKILRCGARCGGRSANEARWRRWRCARYALEMGLAVKRSNGEARCRQRGASAPASASSLPHLLGPFASCARRVAMYARPEYGGADGAETAQRRHRGKRLTGNDQRRRGAPRSAQFSHRRYRSKHETARQAAFASNLPSKAERRSGARALAARPQATHAATSSTEQGI